MADTDKNKKEETPNKEEALKKEEASKKEESPKNEGAEKPSEPAKDGEEKKDEKSAKDNAKAPKAPLTPEEVANQNKKTVDLLCLIGSLLAIGAAVAIFLNKIPKNLKFLNNINNYFYLFALFGFFGVLGKELAILIFGYALPVFLGAITVLIWLRPTQFPLENWWEIYSGVVLFSAGFLMFVSLCYGHLKKNGFVPGNADANAGSLTGADGKLKGRVDPAMAAKYRAEMDKKNGKDTSFDSALGLGGDSTPSKTGDIGVPGVAAPPKPATPQKPNAPVESNEERMEREVREMRDSFNKKSMRLTTTLMRIKNLTKSLDRDQIFANTVEIIAKGLDAKKVQLLLNDEKEGKLCIVKAVGMKPNEYKNFVVSYEEQSMITHLLNQKVNEVVGGAGAFGVKECEMDPQMKGLIGKGVLNTILAVPIYAEGKLFAVINVEEMSNPDYTRDDQNLLTTCADVAGLVMKNAKLYSATMSDLVSAQKLSEDQLKKNEQLKGSLSRIVSPSVAEMIMSDPSALKLGGKKCEVTMFFSDIRGFTKMSENMDPTDIVDQLNVYFTRMTDILMELDGTLDKYVGDELMALFGAPVARKDDPIRAVLCGVRMLEALYQLQEVWKKEGKPVIQIGVGVNTGVVTAGYMGSEKALSYTVIGDNVNLAARIMAQAKGMEMFITRSTYEHVKDYFDIEQRESIMVKGKSMPIEIFWVKKVKDGVDMTQVIGKDVGHIADSLVAEKPKAEPKKQAMILPPGMKEEDMKQNVQIEEVRMIDCGNCGTPNPPQEKFCTKCGMPIF